MPNRFPENGIFAVVGDHPTHDLAGSTSRDLTLGELLALADPSALAGLDLGYGSSAGSEPLRQILAEVAGRYGRPIVVAETGTEGDGRAEWLAYVADEVRAAGASGVRVDGLCWYPIANHPGWDDDRHCPNGLLGYVGPDGVRPVHAPLAAELSRQQARGLDGRPTTSRGVAQAP